MAAGGTQAGGPRGAPSPGACSAATWTLSTGRPGSLVLVGAQVERPGLTPAEEGAARRSQDKGSASRIPKTRSPVHSFTHSTNLSWKLFTCVSCARGWSRDSERRSQSQRSSHRGL